MLYFRLEAYLQMVQSFKKLTFLVQIRYDLFHFMFFFNCDFLQFLKNQNVHIHSVEVRYLRDYSRYWLHLKKFLPLFILHTIMLITPFSPLGSLSWTTSHLTWSLQMIFKYQHTYTLLRRSAKNQDFFKIKSWFFDFFVFFVFFCFLFVFWVFFFFYNLKKRKK